MDLSGYDYLDFGASKAGIFEFAKARLGGTNGLGVHIDPRKVAQTRSLGYDCAVGDITQIDLPEDSVRFVTMSHILSCLPDIDAVGQTLARAAWVASDFLFIQGPFFDADGVLARNGLKFYWSDWTDHTCRLTTEALCATLDALGLHDYVCMGRAEVAGSADAALHPLDSPRDQHDYDPAVHPPKPAVTFAAPGYAEPVYREMVCVVRLRGFPGWPDVVAARKGCEWIAPKLERLTADMDVSGYDFLDFGASAGECIEFAKDRLGGTNGLGVDIDPQKVARMRSLGYDCAEGDVTRVDLPDDSVRFVTMSHILERLPDLEAVRRALAGAARVASDFLFIQGPFFDADGVLARNGLKFYWSDWTDHTCRLTTEALCATLDALGLHDYVCMGRAEVAGSADPAVHPLGSPPDQHDYDPEVHPPKPAVTFAAPGYAEPVYREMVCVVRLRGFPGWPDVVAARKGCEWIAPKLERLTADMDVSGYDFLDFGASAGECIEFAKDRLGGTNGLGVDIDPQKVARMRSLGYDCAEGDVTRVDLPDDSVRFVTMSHILERLPDLEAVRRALAGAARVASDFLFIQGPFFDADGVLARNGLKFYWSDWTDHTCRLTTEALCATLDALGLHDYVCMGRAEVAGSADPAVHPLGSPPDQHDYDPEVHPPKPAVTFAAPGYAEPVYREMVCVVRLRGFPGWPDVVAARKGCEWIAPKLERLTADMDVSGYDFLDFGASAGECIEFAKDRLGGTNGLGVDIDPQKVARMRSLGYDCAEGDVTRVDLPDDSVRFVTMSHILERLPDLEAVRRALAGAARVASDFLFIQGPFFDADGVLARNGLKFYWSDWTDHTCRLTTEALCATLDALGLHDYVCMGRAEVAGSADAALHPLDSPRDQHDYDPAVHPPKPAVTFAAPGYAEPVYREMVCVVRLREFPGWPDVVAARKGCGWIAPKLPKLTADLDMSRYDFLDFGASTGGCIEFAKARLGGTNGLGVDIDPQKVARMRSLDYDCAEGDVTRVDLPDDSVRFVTMSHILEHLPDLEAVKRALAGAARVASDFLFIQGPYFDADRTLARDGLKFYWSDWTYHTCRLTTDALCGTLDALGLRDYVCMGRVPVAGSEDPVVHPVDSPPDQHDYDPDVHPPKPAVMFAAPKYEEPVYREMVCVVRLREFPGWPDVIAARQGCEPIVPPSAGRTADGRRSQQPPVSRPGGIVRGVLDRVAARRRASRS